MIHQATLAAQLQEAQDLVKRGEYFNHRDGWPLSSAFVKHLTKVVIDQGGKEEYERGQALHPANQCQAYFRLSSSNSSTSPSPDELILRDFLRAMRLNSELILPLLPSLSMFSDRYVPLVSVYEALLADLFLCHTHDQYTPTTKNNDKTRREAKTKRIEPARVTVGLAPDWTEPNYDAYVADERCISIVLQLVEIKVSRRPPHLQQLVVSTCSCMITRGSRSCWHRYNSHIAIGTDPVLGDLLLRAQPITIWFESVAPLHTDNDNKNTDQDSVSRGSGCRSVATSVATDVSKPMLFVDVPQWMQLMEDTYQLIKISSQDGVEKNKVTQNYRQELAQRVRSHHAEFAQNQDLYRFTTT
jgi:hypothetical protein